MNAIPSTKRLDEFAAILAAAALLKEHGFEVRDVRDIHALVVDGRVASVNDRSKYPVRKDIAHPSKPRRAKRGGKRNGRGMIQGRVLDIDGDFDTSRAASLTGISTKHAAVLLSTLTRRRLLKRVRRGVYRVGKGK